MPTQPSPESPGEDVTEGQGPPPGWYVDPKGSNGERWWDGNQWTEHLRVGGQPPPVSASAQPQPPPIDLLDVVLKGRNGNLILGLTSAKIVRGAKGALVTLTARGDKVIPYDSIVAVQFKKPGLAAGYLQFSLRGGSEAKSGVTQAVRDENTILFGRNTLAFEKAHAYIQRRISG